MNVLLRESFILVISSFPLCSSGLHTHLFCILNLSVCKLRSGKLKRTNSVHFQIHILILGLYMNTFAWFTVELILTFCTVWLLVSSCADGLFGQCQAPHQEPIQYQVSVPVLHKLQEVLKDLMVQGESHGLLQWYLKLRNRRMKL